MKFSDKQVKILEWVEEGEGNAAINSVAGSGKTFMLRESARVIDTDRSLYCAFNTSIKKEFEPQIRKINPGFDVKTMHGIGYAAISREYAGYNWNEFASPTDPKYRDIALELIDDMSIGKYETFTAANYAVALCNSTRLTLTDPTDKDKLLSLIRIYNMEDLLPFSWAEDIIGCIKAMCIRGMEMVEEIGDDGKRHVDFTDMLWVPHVANLTCKQYEWVMGDEAQDFSKAQQDLIMKSVFPNGRVIIVGDPHQSIYGFAGADSNSFYNMKERLDAIELPLNICYRCPTSVIKVAKEYVPEIEAGPNAAAGIVDTIAYERLPFLVKRGDLILSRTNAPLFAAFFSLISHEIPATIVGRDFTKSLTSMIDKVSKQRGFIYSEFLEFLDRYVDNQKSKILKKNNNYTDDPAIQKIEDKASCIGTLYMNSTNINSVYGLKGFVQKIFSRDEKKASNKVTLSSIHRAKGLEADVVWVFEEDPDRGVAIMPHPSAKQDWEIEQEQNLIYVAVTRAKKELHFIRSKVVGDTQTEE